MHVYVVHARSFLFYARSDVGHQRVHAQAKPSTTRRHERYDFCVQVSSFSFRRRVVFDAHGGGARRRRRLVALAMGARAAHNRCSANPNRQHGVPLAQASAKEEG